MERSRDFEQEWAVFDGKLFRERKESMASSDIGSMDLGTYNNAILWAQRSNAPTCRAKNAYMPLLGDSFVVDTSMIYF